MLLGDVVDELLNDDRLADAGATEESDFAALEEGLDEIDDLDAGLEHFGAGGLLIEGRSQAMNRHAGFGAMGPRLSTGSPITFMTRPRVGGQRER